ncbi:MAG: SPFH domain-containing protein [Actinobacteria bacterium]|nr:MAG: SPFH domain-containing protein [Actinomycetota bacterium]
MAGRLGRGGAPLGALLLAGGVFFIVGLVCLIGLFGALNRTSGGEVAVVRNGGPFDNHRVRQVIDPASGLTWTGWWSQVHKYPAQQRFYTITSEAGRGDRPGVDVVHTPTSDGVNVGIEGTLYFTLTLDHAALKTFDNKFGTRKFRSVDGVARYPFDGDDGWSGFLDQIVRPVIDNDLREQINAFRCAELVSSCSLVQNARTNPVAPGGGHSNNGNIAKVQQAINQSLATDLRGTLGGDFFTSIRFNLVRITLPPKVQNAVDDAQAAFAQVTEAQARVESARADAEANRIRQRGYADCPACARIDELKAIPASVQTFAPGAGFAVTPGK